MVETTNRLRSALSAAVDGAAIAIASIAVGLLLLWWVSPIWVSSP
jgi:hypothetical protein